jgi:hypothetical protein
MRGTLDDVEKQIPIPDPDGDALRYELSRRTTSRWHVVERDLKHPFYTFRSSQLPDGYYRFRVKATDGPAHPAGIELDGVGTSHSVLIDNTPPTVGRLNTTIKSQNVTTRFVVTDNLGPLTEAAYALDGASFRPLIPDDGTLDGPKERFTLPLSALATGSHLLSIRIRNAGNNMGLGQTHFTLPKGHLNPTVRQVR